MVYVFGYNIPKIDEGCMAVLMLMGVISPISIEDKGDNVYVESTIDLGMDEYKIGEEER